jgi:ankyrin repeat protein
MRTIEVGDTEVAKSLIAAGALLDVTDINKRTALIYATTEDNIEVVKSLIAAGAELN